MTSGINLYYVYKHHLLAKMIQLTFHLVNYFFVLFLSFYLYIFHAVKPLFFNTYAISSMLAFS